MHRSVNQAENNANLQTQVDALNEKMTQMQKNMIEMQAHEKQVHFSRNLICKHSQLLILFLLIDDDWH